MSCCESLPCDKWALQRGGVSYSMVGYCKIEFVVYTHTFIQEYHSVSHRSYDHPINLVIQC